MRLRLEADFCYLSIPLEDMGGEMHFSLGFRGCLMGYSERLEAARVRFFSRFL
jgi:hypothetical protein